ncbi:hypothetical protein ASPWEDRAFT_36091 [Aspergillus wentii DTO 134E9]|uniref:Tryptophan synthase n=1 Tax=Aspergillus wentii DTO 134E9 TaxID=1073089 RepID=A0A1L9RUA8_ASPWE|nr:uncharacterized protein ASPWEDRAFT_36091 [Aspergillus wentii DTO 134E9]OJJ38463.1 hypothetical protein ASPWEDRAFT_36091 [Aspergillus wentii DTO 134E9]
MAKKECCNTARLVELMASSWSTCRLKSRYGFEAFVKRLGKSLSSSNLVLSPNHCRLSYIPLIAPCTTDSRMKFLCSIADSFIYVVSKMGVTGASGTLSAGLPGFLDRVHRYTDRYQVPAAVGFGINTREQFVSVSRLAEGVVIGSKIISVLGDAPAGQGSQKVKEYCTYITDRNVPQSYFQSLISANGSMSDDDSDSMSDDDTDILEGSSRSNCFGGQYIPEVLIECLMKLEEGFNNATNDPSFWEEYRSFYPYMNRPSCLHVATQLSKYVGGANIWLKREDLNYTGSHSINNALGQVLLARRLGKTQIVAETGDGQHGVATATVCAKFGMKCTVFMGAKDARRQDFNVSQMKILGATVITVDSGSGTLRDATNQAMQSLVGDLENTYYATGAAIGPHPLPAIVRTFQSVIGNETKDEFRAQNGRLPDAVVACVGSDATGMFHPFISNNDPVKMIGVEAAGEGLDTERHSAVLSKGSIGVLNGSCTYVLQDSEGQIQDTHSIAAGLDYPAVGPELASWHENGQATFTTATDKEALYGFMLLSQLEGITPALETAHAVAGVIRAAKKLGKGKDVVLCLSGRGDKDIETVTAHMGAEIGWF